ncbi:MAG: hypothetical protein ACTHP8_15060 [Bosea sp. (in: a-proteobacteria)]|uniref:hypothetical protein n=1 Tax=Bosea sp. (in: a-proteobacteria) TaxID=1871050 RepID=UPI003F7CA674
MRMFRQIALSATCLLLLAQLEPAAAHRANMALGVKEISSAINGKVCATSGGAHFTFENDGHFSYDGLWQSSGNFTFGDNAVILTFDSGLQRAFEISRRDGGLYMEKTRVVCTAKQ